MLEVAPAAGDAEAAAVREPRHVEEHQVDRHGGAGAHLIVEREVDQVEQCRKVLFVVARRVPLAEPEPEAIVEPPEQARPRGLRVLAADQIAGANRIGAFGAERPPGPEDLVRPELPGQVRGGAEQHLMVLGPVAHLRRDLLLGESARIRVDQAAACGLDGGAVVGTGRIGGREGRVEPELEGQEALLDRRLDRRREVDVALEAGGPAPSRQNRSKRRRRLAMEIEKTQQIVGAEIGGVLEYVHLLERLGEHPAPISGLGLLEVRLAVEIGGRGARHPKSSNWRSGSRRTICSRASPCISVQSCAAGAGPCFITSASATTTGA